MPPIVTNLPWLNNNQDPVATYQRSQQLVQQMQAKQAQERQQQAELAQRVQEAAMQAQFQQRALALKEEEARSSVKLEADRLRQKGQAMEFDKQMAEREYEALNRAPEAVNIPGMPAAIRYRGRLAFPPRMPDTSGVGKAVPVYEDNDPSKPLIGHIAMTNERGGAFTRALRPGETSAEKGQAGLEKEARSTDRRVLMDDRAALNKIKNAISWVDREPQEKADVLQKLGEIEEQLKGYRTVKPKEKPVAIPSPAIKRGVRIRRKSDGKILRYEGNRADVPTGEFEMLE